MEGVISVSDHIRIMYKKVFHRSSADDITDEPYLIVDYVYNIDGELLINTTADESRQRLAECNPSFLRAFIRDMEPLPLYTMMDPEDAEMARETIPNTIALLVRDCVGIEGLKLLQVEVFVESSEEEEGYVTWLQSDYVDFLYERRMNSLQKNVYMGAMMGEENEVCPICLDELRVGEEVACTPCVHYFHEACIGRWLEKNDMCPLCRFIM